VTLRLLAVAAKSAVAAAVLTAYDAPAAVLAAAWLALRLPLPVAGQRAQRPRVF